MSAPGLTATAISRRDGGNADGIHLLFEAPAAAGYSVDGFDIQRRPARDNRQRTCVAFTAEQVQELDDQWALTYDYGAVELRSTANMTLVYDFTFPDERPDVLVDLGSPIVLAVALRQDEAVATVARDVTADFTGRRVDRVLVYTQTRARTVRVCVAEPAPDDDDSWGRAVTIAANVHVPVRTVNRALVSGADERTLADSRLLPGEWYDPTAFDGVVRMLNDAAAVDPDVAPVWSTTLTRRDPAAGFVEVRSWAYATLPRLDPQWRRMLGLAYLDPDSNLIPGQRYDYRILGRFRRRDLTERLLGFHGVPLGLVLPATFALDDVMLTTPSAATVQLFPAAGPTTLQATGRKGVLLRDRGTGCLRIELSAPMVRIALDVDPGHKLSYAAQSTSTLIGPPPAHFAGSVPARSHAVLDFTAPVDTIQLTGAGILYGLRTDVDPTADPDDLVTYAEEILGVVYESTPGPPPPSAVTAANLQTLAVAAAGEPPPQPLGFRVSWLPEPAAASWPPDLAASPPLDVMSFGVERRRVDTNGGWQEIADDTAFFAARGGAAEPVLLYPGQDLLAAFPERRPPQPPVSRFMRVEDQLERTGGDPPPGSTHCYRVHAVDALGRASAPVESPVVRLEKHAPPPPPAGRPDAQVPTGVTARLLQGADPALPQSDVDLLAGAATAVVIEWGWAAEQRARDPYVTEFRLYWDPAPPDVLEGEFTGAATSSAAGWTMAATLPQPVTADALVGRYLRAGERPFQVVGNSAGTSITVELARSAIDPRFVPAAGAFVFQPVLDSSELRPARWPRRSAIVPLTGDDSYRHVFAETVTLDAAHPAARVWTGVSAADAQSYVADELPAAAPNGGRPGNESRIAPAPAAGRWIGRPGWAWTLPLPDVPEQRTDEPTGNDVRAVVDLPALLAGTPIPAGMALVAERLALSDVIAALSVTPAGTVQISPPAGPAVAYQPANAADQAALLAQIGSGEPIRVERRFLMEALLHALPGFEASWRPAVDDTVALGPVQMVLPVEAERYALRVRIVDAAGRRSAEAAVLGLVLRVPSLRAAGSPVLTLTADDTDAVQATARVRDAPDLDAVCFFSTEIGAAGAPGAELLRTPNRPDLYPDRGIRLRLPDGALLSPTAVAVAVGVSEIPDRIVPATVTVGYGSQVAVWAATLTRDGVPSSLAGPAVAVTGPQPLVVPELAVTTVAGEDQAVWGTPAVPAETALQHSGADGSWAQVSPWLPPAVTAYALPGDGTGRYRLMLRASRGRTATGPEVIPS